tara:strand:+ start:1189 stop:1383 length:195 start_codon:yes stop_codon:yes gene_type:complete
MASVQVDAVSATVNYEDVTWSLAGSSTEGQVGIKIEDTSDPVNIVASIDRAKALVVQYLGTLGT